MAYASGADFLELDLVMTKDGHLIVLHDLTLNATTDVEQVFPDRARKDGKYHAVDFNLHEVKQLKVHERSARREPGKPFPIVFRLIQKYLESPPWRK